jgi:uncharacterized protein YjbJ (UPF0337 family)
MYHAVTRRRVEEVLMSRDTHEGRWLQIQGRAKRTWARVVGSDELEARGNADVVVGALQETVGVAKDATAHEIARSVDAIASFAKRTARSIAR